MHLNLNLNEPLRHIQTFFAVSVWRGVDCIPQPKFAFHSFTVQSGVLRYIYSSSWMQRVMLGSLCALVVSKIGGIADRRLRAHTATIQAIKKWNSCTNTIWKKQLILWFCNWHRAASWMSTSVYVQLEWNLQNRRSLSTTSLIVFSHYEIRLLIQLFCWGIVKTVPLLDFPYDCVALKAICFLNQIERVCSTQVQQ